MKFLYSTLIYFLCLISVSQVFAQFDMPAIKKNMDINNNRSILVTNYQQDWDLVFSYDITSISGKSANAGVTYVSEWDEIWTTEWYGSNTVDIWNVSDTSITLAWTDLQVSGVVGIRGMTEDGTNIFAANNSDTIWVLTNGFPEVDTIIIAPFDVRYISYDPYADNDNGGFWIGNWYEDPTLIDRSGNIIRTLNYSDLGVESIYGGVYDYLSLDGPYLWLWGQGNGQGYPQNIVQIDPSTGLPTGVQHDVLSDVEIGQDSSLAGGLFISDELITDKIILGGILQGDSDYLFGYDITSSIIITFSPTVYTNAATDILETSATLNATINPNGSSTTYNFELGTTTSYGTTLSNGSVLTGSADIDVNFNVTDLTPSTTYHYRIVATNNGGTSYGEDQTFTTTVSSQQEPTVITSAATNITSSSATLNGSVNPNGLNTTYSFEYGLTTSYGSTISAGTELTGTTNQSVTANVSGLTANTNYHYRITAANSAGTSFGDDIQFTTSDSQDLADLAWKSLQLSDFVWESGNSINYELKVTNLGLGNSASSAAQIYLSTDNIIETSDIAAGSQISVPAINAGDSTILNGSFTIPAANQGIYYTGVIVDVNSTIAESNENNNNYTRNGKIVVGYSSSIQLLNTVTFNSIEQTSSFRMIGLPGNNNIPISDLLTGSYNQDWVAYYDNGNTDDYLVAYDGSSNFNLTPGKGFWVLSSNNISVSRSAANVELESNYVGTGTYEIVYPISLHNGWNIISNPFNSDISWSSVQSFNSVNESLHSFNGSFLTNSTFEPYEGYYFYNVNNLTSLQIPYTSSQALTKENHISSSVENLIELSLLKEEKPISKVSVGLSEESATGYDKHDRFMPPGDFENIRLSINNESIERPYKFLKQDIREKDNNHSFDLIVKNTLEESIKIIANENGTIQAEEIYLIDNNYVFHNLREENIIDINSPNKNVILKILIGDEEYIKSQRSLLTPKIFSLSQNYPNPFNPETIISFTIPQKELVTLSIYDLLGRKVDILVNEEKSAGQYELKFNAAKYASGIYVYSISAGEYYEARKMMLLK